METDSFPEVMAVLVSKRSKARLEALLPARGSTEEVVVKKIAASLWTKLLALSVYINYRLRRGGMNRSVSSKRRMIACKTKPPRESAGQ
jgi:hypothetical protein